MTCALCVEPAGDVVFEDGWTRVILHEDGSPRGHAMVVSRRHVENASDLDEEEFAHLARVWHRAERALLDATGAERAIILKLGILTPHLHVHIYPVGSEATREDVFAAIDGRAGTKRDELFVEKVRLLLSTSAPAHLTLPPC
jgi:diadenosine tetraphosphate (Ap4A) HIT family hydrolase